MIMRHNAGGLVIVDMSSGREGEAVLCSQTGSPGGDVGMEYEPIGEVFVAYQGGATLYRCEPPSDYRNGDGSLNSSATYPWTTISNGVGGATPSANAPNGTYGRFRYISSIRGFAVINQPTDSMYVYKIPTAGL